MRPSNVSRAVSRFKYSSCCSIVFSCKNKTSYNWLFMEYNLRTLYSRYQRPFLTFSVFSQRIFNTFPLQQPEIITRYFCKMARHFETSTCPVIFRFHRYSSIQEIKNYNIVPSQEISGRMFHVSSSQDVSPEGRVPSAEMWTRSTSDNKQGGKRESKR